MCVLETHHAQHQMGPESENGTCLKIASGGFMGAKQSDKISEQLSEKKHRE